MEISVAPVVDGRTVVTVKGYHFVDVPAAARETEDAAPSTESAVVIVKLKILVILKIVQIEIDVSRSCIEIRAAYETVSVVGLNDRAAGVFSVVAVSDVGISIVRVIRLEEIISVSYLVVLLGEANETADTEYPLSSLRIVDKLGVLVTKLCKTEGVVADDSLAVLVLAFALHQGGVNNVYSVTGVCYRLTVSKNVSVREGAVPHHPLIGLSVVDKGGGNVSADKSVSYVKEERTLKLKVASGGVPGNDTLIGGVCKSYRHGEEYSSSVYNGCSVLVSYRAHIRLTYSAVEIKLCVFDLRLTACVKLSENANVGHVRIAPEVKSGIFTRLSEGIGVLRVCAERNVAYHFVISVGNEICVKEARTGGNNESFSEYLAVIVGASLDDLLPLGLISNGHCISVLTNENLDRRCVFGGKITSVSTAANKGKANLTVFDLGNIYGVGCKGSKAADKTANSRLFGTVIFYKVSAVARLFGYALILFKYRVRISSFELGDPVLAEGHLSERVLKIFKFYDRKFSSEFHFIFLSFRKGFLLFFVKVLAVRFFRAVGAPVPTDLSVCYICRGDRRLSVKFGRSKPLPYGLGEIPVSTCRGGTKPVRFCFAISNVFRAVGAPAPTGLVGLLYL